MTRGARGSAVGSEGDAFCAIRDLLERIGGRDASPEEVEEVRGSLELLYSKLMRLRSLSPAFRRVDFSEKVWALMRRIGKPAMPATRSPLGRAASFL